MIGYKLIISSLVFVFYFYLHSFAFSLKQPEFGGKFYPQKKEELSAIVDGFLDKASDKPLAEEVFMLISPHAGYGYSGQVAASGYKMVKGKPYKTVIILGTSHHKVFNGAAFYGRGVFSTSLGEINVDEEFIKSLSGKIPEFFSDNSVFEKEHSIEVQLPFLQRALAGPFTAQSPVSAAADCRWKVVPVVVSDCSLRDCERIALLFKEAIGKRKDVLVVASSDLYHGYDFQEAESFDAAVLDFIRKMDYQGLYYALREGRAQACGGIGVVIALALAKESGCVKTEVLEQTNSAVVTGKTNKGDWTVGYASCAVFSPKGGNVLDIQQRKKLLKIARQAIEKYLETGEKLEVSETDPVLNRKMGSFVTLSERGQLRGCIGNLTANQPLCLTVRDMAIAAAVDDWRFSPVSLAEIKNIELEISVLSPLERIVSAENIELGKHGVLVRKGAQSGVFLPQVAGETGWSKEEFLNNLCSQKAGLPADAWKDKSCELYVFSAEVFSEKKAEK